MHLVQDDENCVDAEEYRKEQPKEKNKCLLHGKGFSFTSTCAGHIYAYTGFSNYSQKLLAMTEDRL